MLKDKSVIAEQGETQLMQPKWSLGHDQILFKGINDMSSLLDKLFDLSSFFLRTSNDIIAGNCTVFGRSRTPKE